MQREILFRGKRIDNGEMVIGLLLTNKLGSYIITEENPHVCDQFGYMEIEQFHLVIPETIGQFTGQTDKNNNKIFDGEIISDYTETDSGVVKSHIQVFWSDDLGGWAIDESYHQDKGFYESLVTALRKFDYEVSGNIYETPELIQTTHEKETNP